MKIMMNQLQKRASNKKCLRWKFEKPSQRSSYSRQFYLLERSFTHTSINSNKKFKCLKIWKNSLSKFKNQNYFLNSNIAPNLLLNSNQDTIYSRVINFADPLEINVKCLSILRTEIAIFINSLNAQLCRVQLSMLIFQHQLLCKDISISSKNES